jgi:hypothetical protein
MSRYLQWLRARINLGDVGIVGGLSLVDYGLFQWSSPAGWVFLGLAIGALSVILGLPRSTTPPTRPSGDR